MLSGAKYAQKHKSWHCLQPFSSMYVKHEQDFSLILWLHY